MNNKPLLFLIIFSALYSLLKADDACMDRSRHAYFCNDGQEVCNKRYHDNKKLHKVPCSCPCWRYKATKKCRYCGHYRDPFYNNHPGETRTYPTIKLCKGTVPKQRPLYYVQKRIKRCQD